jgi:hypothetical protein
MLNRSQYVMTGLNMGIIALVILLGSFGLHSDFVTVGGLLEFVATVIARLLLLAFAGYSIIHGIHGMACWDGEWQEIQQDYAKHRQSIADARKNKKEARASKQLTKSTAEAMTVDLLNQRYAEYHQP